MDSIIIGFSRPKAWFEPFSWLIRLAYWSPFSHAYIRFQIKEPGMNLIFQASGLEVNLIGKTLFDSREDIYKEFVIPIDNQEKMRFIQFAVTQLGKPYNVLGIFGMAWVRIGQILRLKFKSPFPYNGSSDFCSELVGYVLENYSNVNPGNIADLSPQDLYNLLNAQLVSQ